MSLPPQPVLTEMFGALLAGIDQRASQAEQALLLAQRLPIGLSRVQDLRPDPRAVPAPNPARKAATAGADPATQHREPRH